MRRRKAVWISVVVTLLFAATAGFMFVSDPKSNAIIAAFKQAPSPEPNAWEHIVAAQTASEDENLKTPALDMISGKTPFNADWVAVVTQTNSEALAALHRAIDVGQARAPITVYDYNQDFASTDMSYRAAIKLTRLLQLQAMLAQKQGEPKQAATLLLDALAYADLLKHSKAGLIAQTIASAMIHMAAAQLAQLVWDSPADADWYHALIAAIPHGHDMQMYRDMLIGEMVYMDTMNDWMLLWCDPTTRKKACSDEKSGELSSDCMEGKKSAISDEMKTFCNVVFFRHFLNSFYDPRADALEMAGQPLTVFPAARNVFDNDIYSTFVIATNGFPMGVYRDYFANAYQAEWQLDATRVLIALHGYKAEHGSFPKTLDALVPAWIARVPTDPFDGLPMRYRPDKGYLYSIGWDVKDDGGEPAQVKKCEANAWPRTEPTLPLQRDPGCKQAAPAGKAPQQTDDTPEETADAPEKTDAAAAGTPQDAAN